MSEINQLSVRASALDAIRAMASHEINAPNILVTADSAEFSKYISCCGNQNPPVLASCSLNAAAPNLIQYGTSFENDLAAHDEQLTTPWTRWQSPPGERVAREELFIEIELSDASVESFPYDESLSFCQPTVDCVIAPNGELIARRATQPEFSFDFACEGLGPLTVLTQYIAECKRQASESLKRFYRKLNLSSAVSKNGHLSFLTVDRKVCIETTARNNVVHLQVIALAEEHEETPGPSTGALILRFGEVLWTRIKRSCLSLFSDCLEKALCVGSTGAGLSAEAP